MCREATFLYVIICTECDSHNVAVRGDGLRELRPTKHPMQRVGLVVTTANVHGIVLTILLHETIRWEPS